MNSFIELYKLYRDITRWKILRQIYNNCSKPQKLGMWLVKILFSCTAIWVLVTPEPSFAFLLLPPQLWLWAYIFTSARKAAFAPYYSQYPDCIEYYGKGYQYIRYLEFKTSLKNGNGISVKKLDAALKHLDEQIETEFNSPISSHPFMSLQIAGLLTLIGGTAADWPKLVTVMTSVSLVVSVYFSYIIIGLTRTPLANLKEFKRFLLWLKEQEDNPAKQGTASIEYNPRTN